jgi:hypothetical protein
MDWLSNHHVCELSLAENNLIQVLVSNFHLFRHGNSAQLEIRFDYKTPTIRRREAKGALMACMRDFKSKAKKYQEKLDAILLENCLDKFMYNDSDFVFRYASGGTLPILRMGEVDYYCLFYRDIYPIGWNIANGACDSLEELINPNIAVKRELREELIILDLANDRDYVFSWDTGKTLDRPEFVTARNLWQRVFPDKNFRRFEQHKVPLEWLNGPDLLTVTMGDNTPITLSGCFLNINALDFGIEVDKIAAIKVGRNSTLLDGEICDNKLLNRPIGLFNVRSFEEKVYGRETVYFPDLLFYSGRPHLHTQIGQLISEEFIPRLIKERLRTHEHAKALEETEQKYNLCPVTSRIVLRYLASKKEKPLLQEKGYEIFISYSSKDKDFANKLYTDLRAKWIGCWFAPEHMKIGDKIRSTIDRAIRAGDKLLIILSKNSIQSAWVEKEVETAFEEEIRRNEIVLFPIRLDNTIMKTEEAWAADIRRTRHIGNFQEWKDNNSYHQALNRLLRDLQANDQ